MHDVYDLCGFLRVLGVSEPAHAHAHHARVCVFQQEKGPRSRQYAQPYCGVCGGGDGAGH